MSTIAYAQFTTARDAAQPGTSSSTQKPGVSTYVDALAALVPAEVLTLHGLILTATTKVENGVTTITELPTLRWAFWGLIVLAAALYAVSRVLGGKLDKFDVFRVLIPPSAVVAWTMLQRATAFDAVCGDLGQAPRTVVALFLAVLLGIAAGALAYKADQRQ